MAKELIEYGVSPILGNVQENYFNYGHEPVNLPEFESYAQFPSHYMSNVLLDAYKISEELGMVHFHVLVMK